MPQDAHEMIEDFWREMKSEEGSYVFARHCRCGEKIDFYVRWNGLQHVYVARPADCPSCGEGCLTLGSTVTD